MGSQKRIVIKLGTSTLTAGSKSISLPHLVDLARQVAELQSTGWQVILVSSGAIAAGREALGFPSLPRFIPAKQMLAAVGQPRLMALYETYFRIYQVRVAQVLLTRADLAERSRYLNARNTLEALLAHNVVPIINENDTLATEEIRFGDNDSLSAHVASLIDVDLLVLMTDQPGLFTGDPRSDPDARLVPEVSGEQIPEALWEAAGGSVSGLGTGGMHTKLAAADLARRCGTTVWITLGTDPDVLVRAVKGELRGTRFLPTVSHLEGRKRYMLSGIQNAPQLVVDAGAARAIRAGSSLLPAGLARVEGAFGRGETVRIVGPTGKDLAAGLVNYNDHDLNLLRGKQSSDIENLLGYTFGDEVVHRNNLVKL